jgi:hypothetical protein
MTSDDFFASIDLKNPETDREWMECQRHTFCEISQGWANFFYETLSQYESDQLDDEQNAFVLWFEQLGMSLVAM